MPENKLPQYNYPLDPNLTPVKKPSPLKASFGAVSPKKKITLWIILTVIIIALGFGLYFLLAAENPTYYFTLNGTKIHEQNLTIYRGQTVTIGVHVEAGDDSSDTIRAFKMEIDYSDNIFDNEANQINQIAEAAGVTGNIDRTANKITFQSLNAGFMSIEPRQSKQIGSITVTVADQAPIPGPFRLTFTADNQVTLDQGAVEEPDLKNASLQTAQYSGANLFLEPTDFKISIGQVKEYALKLDSGNDDIIAIRAEIKYNPEVIGMQVVDSPEFPVTGPEGQKTDSNNNRDKIYTLIRGKYGDGNGQKQDTEAVTIVYIRITGLNAANTTLLLQNIKIVKDDGQGTSEEVANSSYSLNIESSSDMPTELIISNAGYSCAASGGYYDITVTWDTNLPADSQVYITGHQTAKDENLVSYGHNLTVEGADERGGDITITSYNSTVDSQAVFKIEDYDCEFAVAKLQIHDLTVTPGSEDATVVFMTVGGPNNGRANGNVSGAGSASPSSTASTNLHRFKLTGLTENQEYTVTVTATAGGETVQRTIKFVTKEDTSLRTTNINLKVNPDRVCDKWLNCNTAVQITNTKGKVENLCFDVGLCDMVNEFGECISSINPGQLGVIGGNQTFISPNQEETTEKIIKNMSGLSKVGMDWGNGKIITGYLHYADMSTLGKSINILNGNFELGDFWPWTANAFGKINLVRDLYEPANTVLKISTDSSSVQGKSGNLFAGAQVPLGNISAASDYVLSFDIRSDTNGKKIRVQARTGNQYSELFSVTAGQGFQRITQKIERQLPGGETTLLFNQTSSDNSSFLTPFYIDNVSMKPLLYVQTAEAGEAEKLIARDCRMYPSSNAPECNYTDPTGGKLYTGWQGFCVEEDPGYENMCLNWWPVDIIAGETDIFGSDPQLYYKDRKPLYYCLEAAGNYPFKRLTRAKYGIAATKASGLTVYLAESEQGLRLIDIERIELEPLCEEGDDDTHCFSKKENSEAFLILSRDNSWQDLFCSGGNCQDDDWYWTKSNLWQNGGMLENSDTCGNMAIDLYAIRARFQDGIFIGLENGLCNWGAPEPGSVRYKVTFYLREPCNVLAQVIDPYGQGASWASRIISGGWTEENKLGYIYNQDYAPYGAAVVPLDANHPENWVDPLYVMPPEKNLGLAPYQARAGSPYAIRQGSGKTCQNSKRQGEPCSIDSDCHAWSPSTGRILEEGICSFEGAVEEYGTMCIAGERSKLGSGCSSSYDCGYGTSGTPGLCMGFDITEEQKEIIGNGYMAGKQRLSNLFAKSLQVWRWDPFSDKYYSDGVCSSNDDYCWDITQSQGKKPQVTNLTVNGKENAAELRPYQGTAGVVLRFNSLVNENQMPLVSITVDWGDDQTTDLTNLNIVPRSDPNNPHVLLHTYSCDESSGCNFKPTVTIRDNWGMESDATEIEGEIMVEPQ